MKTYTQMKSIQNFNKKALLGALVAAGLTMVSTGVYAGTTTGTMQTTAILANSCSISAAPTLAFGSAIATFDGRADVTANTSNLTIACTSGSGSPTIYSDTTRNMTAPGGALLPFYLSLTADAVSNDLSLVSTTPSPSGIAAADGSAKPLTIYGRIPTGSFTNKPAGTYSAEITLTVVYP